MEHETDSYTHDEHNYGQDDSSAHPHNEFEFTVEETQPEVQPEQTDPRNQQQYQSRAPGYAPPSRPAPTMPPRNYPPQSNQQNYPPQAIPQQFPPQPGYYPPPGQPVQAPPQQYHPQSYNKAPPTSPYHNPTGVNYQNGGYAAPAPAPGYPQQSPYQPYQRNTGTVGWSTGLFDCMDDPNNALVTACCPCFTFGQIAEIVDSGHTTCATSGILYGVIAAFTLVPCLISCTYRTKMRNHYDLVEVPAADWITHCFCEWCALCQEYRELKNRGIDPAIGWQGNMMRNQQQPQVAMMPPVNQAMRG